jgi:biotin carboxyl carrier protein
VKHSSFHSERGVSARWTLLVIALTLGSVLLPFFLWRATWFGSPLSNSQIQQRLTDTSDPRETQHALSQVADRIIRGDSSVKPLYPDVARLANSPVAQIRETAAWVMGQDNTVSQFHQTLLELLRDPQSLVRMNAALALVRFHDASGHGEIIHMLSGQPVLAPESGVLKRELDVGQGVVPDTLVARIQAGKKRVDVHSPVPGSLTLWEAADGARVDAGQPIAMLAPTSEMAWESLRALYLIGVPDDLNVIAPYARGIPGMPEKVADQARLTMQEIHRRSGS